jgi:hypothetical protein
LTSVHKSLPTYLGNKKPSGPESGKRTHGRSMEDSFEEVRRMSSQAAQKKD